MCKPKVYTYCKLVLNLLMLHVKLFWKMCNSCALSKIVRSSAAQGVFKLNQLKTFLAILLSDIFMIRIHNMTISHCLWIEPGTQPVSLSAAKEGTNLWTQKQEISKWLCFAQHPKLNSGPPNTSCIIQKTHRLDKAENRSYNWDLYILLTYLSPEPKALPAESAKTWIPFS